ncbi:phytanoyl-CoA dioxygenase family protein [Aquihabitans sp. McL0605]|uniref:phytanoyl-CoA dioxygenase family protein n=1 Tax=Aquihabitans sp. McL0605 TaxID=3415671 RepID=UPI003CFAF3F5
MSVDLRTRSDADPVAVEPGAFLSSDLPTALVRRWPRPAGPPSPLPRPLLLEVDGSPWTLAFHDGVPRVDPGDRCSHDRHVHLRLTAALLQDLVTDQITPIGLMTAGTLDLPHGRIGSVLDWWLVLRDALDESPQGPASEVDLPADLARSFTLDDDPGEVRTFLEQTGFAHLRGVFEPGEMARISADMDAAAGTYSNGDGRSWWAGTADGSDRLVRMQHFEDHSPTADALLADDRFLALGRIPGCGHRFGGFAESRWEALFKPIGVTSGISDVPWHKDCSLGRHSYECSRLTVGVSVTGAGPTTGQLRVVAGSNRALIWPSLLDVTELGLPDVPLATETGDVTLHLSCTLHMAQPPTTAERRVLYTSFTLPPPDPAAQERAHRRLVATARESAPLTVTQRSTV